MITFGEVKNSTIAEVAGVCVDSDRFKQLVNDATRQLMRRGDFSGTIVPIYTCVRNGCVVFPRYVGQVRKARQCHNPVILKNDWYNFLDFDTDFGVWRNTFALSWDMHKVSTGATEVCTFDTIAGDGRYVRIYPAVRADVGAEVQLFGIDNNGQPLRTNNHDGTWSDGITVTVALPYGSTNTFIRRIDRVLKPKTQGTLRAYAYYAANDILEPLAMWEPSELSPSYSRYELKAGCNWNTCTNSDGTQGLYFMVKLRFIPVDVDSDLVLINNIDSLKLMIQSIRYGEAGDLVNKRAYEMDAVKEGNLQLWDEQQEDQVPVVNSTFSGQRLGQQSVW